MLFMLTIGDFAIWMSFLFCLVEWKVGMLGVVDKSTGTYTYMPTYW